MKTRELIAALQEQDPSGDLEVIAGGVPIYFVSCQPAYYDGPLRVLVHDESKRGKCYSVVGFKVTSRGEKVRLHLMDVEDVLFDNPDAPVDLSEASAYSREQWEKHVEFIRQEARDIKLDTEKWAARMKEPSPEDLEKQRRSFAYGNAALDNPNVTREMVDAAAEKIAREE